MVVSEEDRLPDAELLGQMSYVHYRLLIHLLLTVLSRTMLFAATDTTSSAMSRILHILSEKPDVQQKLREEIIATRAGRDQIPYDELTSMPFFDAVCRETLRLYVLISP